MMLGSEGSRPAAKYQADRALLLLLLTAPFQYRLSQRAAQQARDLREIAARRLGSVGPAAPAARIKRLSG